MSEPALTQHVAELVRKLFWRKSGSASVAVQGGSQAVAVADNAPNMNQPVVASRLQLIGLAKVRSALGDRWPKLAERVRAIAQTIIDKHLLPGDICEPHNDEGFLVLFPQLSLSDAKFKSDAICHEIERRLIGENLSDVSACIAEVTLMGPAGALLAASASVPDVIEDEDSGEKIAAKLKRLRRRGDYGAKHSAGASAQKEKTAGDEKNAAGTAEDEFSGGAAARKHSGTDEEDEETSERTLGQDEESNEPSGVLVPIVKGEAPLKDGNRARRHSDVEWLYRPVWDFKHATLIMFALHAQTAEKSTGDGEAEIILDADTAAVWKCVNDLQALSASGRRLPLLTRIHYGTIDNPRRRAFFAGTVRNIPAEFRKLISFEIVGCPHGGLNFGICGFIGALKQSGVRVALRVDSKWPDFLAAERAGAQIVTMDTFEQEAPESERMIAFEIFAARAGNAKMEAAMWGLGSRSLVVAAASAGIRYLAGGAVSPSISNLSHAVRFSPIDLYPHS